MTASPPLATPLSALDVVVLDTETTGLDARVARIIQIGALRIAGGRLQEPALLDRLVNPGEAIPSASTSVHGIRDADVAGQSDFAGVAERLDQILGGAVVVGHTIGFDTTVLETEMHRAGRTWRGFRTLDVRIIAELVWPSLANYSLETIAQISGVAVVARHTALGDATTTAGVYLALLPHLRRKGIRTLGELERACRGLAERQAAAGLARGIANPPASEPSSALPRVDSFPYRHLVRDVMATPAVWCDPTATVAEALKTLMTRGISSVLVAGANDQPGIVTERDLLRLINAQGTAALARPVASIAIRPLHTVRFDTHVYRAIGRLDRLNVKHLPVTDANGAIVGMVTTRNLLRHRAQSAIVLGDEVEAADDVGGLAAAWGRLPLVARSLLDDDLDSRAIVNVVSTEICALTRRAAELAERHLLAAGRGAPPCPYAVLVLGSAGRGESQLAADQDNAIVYQADSSDRSEDRWFAELGTRMCETLDAVGIPFCKGGVMARNEAWRKSAQDWMKTSSSWVRRQRPEDLLNTDIFYDAVVVHGDTDLGERVLAHAFAVAQAARDFQLQLSELARRRQNPFTLFGNLKSDADGRVDLKKTGLFPIVAAARAMALRQGIRVRGTADRLKAIAAPEGSDADIERLLGAHRDILRFILRQQLADIDAGVPPSPRIAIKSLSKADQNALTDALRMVGIATNLVGEGRI